MVIFFYLIFIKSLVKWLRGSLSWLLWEHVLQLALQFIISLPKLFFLILADRTEIKVSWLALSSRWLLRFLTVNTFKFLFIINLHRWRHWHGKTHLRIINRLPDFVNLSLEVRVLQNIYQMFHRRDVIGARIKLLFKQHCKLIWLNEPFNLLFNPLNLTKNIHWGWSGLLFKIPETLNIHG